MTSEAATKPEKGTLDYGAYNALLNALRVQQGERVVIIGDAENLNVSDAFFREADALAGDGNVEDYVMEDLGTRPLTSFPAGSELEASLKKADVTIYAAGTQAGELAFRRPMMEVAVGNGARHGHAVGVNEQIMLTGMQAEIWECNARCAELYKRLNGINWMRITSPAGTDVTLEFDPRVKWINSDWDFSKPGEWHNLPSGEVFTWPHRVNGIYVVDGVLGDHFDQRFGALAESPVTYNVRDGHIEEIACENRDLGAELDEYVFDSHNGDIIGEVGVGALEIPSGLVHRMLQDEKLSGTAHIAHGATYSERTGAPDYGQPTHCDGIMLNVTLETSRGDTILREGTYQSPY